MLFPGIQKKKKWLYFQITKNGTQFHWVEVDPLAVALLRDWRIMQGIILAWWWEEKVCPILCLFLLKQATCSFLHGVSHFRITNKSPDNKNTNKQFICIPDTVFSTLSMQVHFSPALPIFCFSRLSPCSFLLAPCSPSSWVVVVVDLYFVFSLLHFLLFLFLPIL